MRFCALLGLASVGLGQTINTSVTVNWELSTSWNELKVPLDTAAGGFTEVAVEGGAQVFVTAGAGVLAVFNPLRIGSSLAANAAVDANTALVLTSRAFNAYALTWNRGSIIMNGTATAKFWLTPGLLPAQTGEASCEGNNDRVVSGGTFSLTSLSTKTVWVKAGSLTFANAHLDFNGNEISVDSGATLQFTGQCAVDTALALKGAGQAVITATADLAVDASLTVSAAKTSVKGNLTLAASRVCTIAGAGAELAVETGARVQRAAASTAVHVAVEAGGTLRFAAGAMMSAKASVEGGLVEVRNGGRAVVDAGVALLASHLTFQSNATLNINFGAGTAQATGTVTIAAGAILRLDGAEPTAKVVLATAATITGQFGSVYVNGQLLASAAAGRRLLAGTVVYNNNTIEYQPGASNSASKAQYLVALIAPVFLLL